MLRADDYPIAQLPSLGPKVVQWLAELVVLPQGASVRIGEPLSIWTLSRGAVPKLGTQGTAASSLAMESGRWHHRLLVDGVVDGYAISRVDGGRPRVVEVGTSETVPWLGEALRRAAVLPGRGDILVRLLEIPRIDAQALWLTRADGRCEFALLGGGSPALMTESELRAKLLELPSRGGLVPPPGGLGLDTEFAWVAGRRRALGPSARWRRGADHGSARA